MSGEENSVLLSDTIIERAPRQFDIRENNQNNEIKPKKSKFAQKLNKKKQKSLDFSAPIGTFLPKSSNIPRTTRPPRDPTKVSKRDNTKGQASLSEELANCGIESIDEALTEITQHLSTDKIEFLRKRGQNKKLKSGPRSIDENPSSLKHRVVVDRSRSPVEEELIVAEEKDEKFNDDETSEKLSLGELIPLLRSQVIRQRVLAAKLLLRDYGLDSGACVNQETVELLRSHPMLPVSLRAILDEVRLTKLLAEPALYLSTLQCLYSLLLVFSGTAASFQRDEKLYCFYFMEDDLPIIPGNKSQGEYSSIEFNDSVYVNDSLNGNVSTYEQDGVSFYRDPEWTFLTKFKIIPCFCNLLSVNKRLRESSASKNDTALSCAALGIICEILSIVVQRSPAAATAVAQHRLILQELSIIAFESNLTNLHRLLDISGLPFKVLRLVCSVARQSRQAASSKPMAEVIPHLKTLLAVNAQTSEESFVQSYALITWRTFLKYGLGISELLNFIHLASASISVKDPSSNPKFEVATDYIQVLSYICYLAQLVTNYYNAESKSQDDSVLSTSSVETLMNAGFWLLSCVQSTSSHLLSNDPCYEANDEKKIRLLAARMALLAFFTRSSGDIVDENNSKSMERALPIAHCIDVLRKLIATKIFGFCLDQVLESCFIDNTDCFTDKAVTKACSSSFVKSFVSLFDVVIENGGNQELQQLKASFVSLIFGKMKNEATLSRPISSAEESKICHITLSCLNSVHFSLARFLLKGTSYLDICEERRDKLLSFSLCLVGRLQVGEEAYANELFRLISMNIGDPNMKCFQHISKMMMQEIGTRSARTRNQLTHSCLLKNVLSHSALILKSLKREAEISPADRNEDSEPFLPLGKHWFFQILSGFIGDKHGYVSIEAAQNAGDVVLSTLEAIKQLEDKNSEFVHQLPLGTKLYFIMNLLLQDEFLFRDDQISRLLLTLSCKYVGHSSSFQNRKLLVSAFIKSCSAHMGEKSLSYSSKNFDNIADKNAAKMLGLFEHSDLFDDGFQQLSSADLKSINEYFVDIASSFCEYGGQYETFVLLLRRLLTLPFPAACLETLLARITDALSFLTLPGDEIFDRDNSICVNELVQCIWTDPKIFTPYPFPATRILTFSIARPNAGGNIRPICNGFCYYLTICILTKGVVYTICSQSDEGVSIYADAFRLRLNSLYAHSRKQVFLAAFNFIRHARRGLDVESTDFNLLQDLVEMVLTICNMDNDQIINLESQLDVSLDKHFNEIITHLRAKYLIKQQ